MFDKRNNHLKWIKRLEIILRKKFLKQFLERKIIEALPLHGLPCVIYDKTCLGSKFYNKLAQEFLAKKNLNVGSAAHD